MGRGGEASVGDITRRFVKVAKAAERQEAIWWLTVDRGAWIETRMRGGAPTQVVCIVYRTAEDPLASSKWWITRHPVR